MSVHAGKLAAAAETRRLRIGAEQWRRDNIQSAYRRLLDVLPCGSAQLKNTKICFFDRGQYTKLSLLTIYLTCSRAATTYIRNLDSTYKHMQEQLRAAEVETAPLQKVSDALIFGTARQRATAVVFKEKHMVTAESGLASPDAATAATVSTADTGSTEEAGLITGADAASIADTAATADTDFIANTTSIADAGSIADASFVSSVAAAAATSVVAPLAAAAASVVAPLAAAAASVMAPPAAAATSVMAPPAAAAASVVAPPAAVAATASVVAPPAAAAAADHAATAVTASPPTISVDYSVGLLAGDGSFVGTDSLYFDTASQQWYY